MLIPHALLSSLLFLGLPGTIAPCNPYLHTVTLRHQFQVDPVGGGINAAGPCGTSIADAQSLAQPAADRPLADQCRIGTGTWGGGGIHAGARQGVHAVLISDGDRGTCSPQSDGIADLQHFCWQKPFS